MVELVLKCIQLFKDFSFVKMLSKSGTSRAFLHIPGSLVPLLGIIQIEVWLFRSQLAPLLGIQINLRFLLQVLVSILMLDQDLEVLSGSATSDHHSYIVEALP